MPRKQPPGKQKPKAKFSDAQLKAAMDAVLSGRMSVRVAGEAHGKIPKSTLNDHLKKVAKTRKMGRPTLFTPQEEEKMVNYIKFRHHLRRPLTRQEVGMRAEKIMDRSTDGRHFKTLDGHVGEWHI